jgi:hypothetical protein
LSRQLEQLAELSLGRRTCTAVVLSLAKHQVEGVDAPGIAEPARLMRTGTRVDHLDEAGIDVGGPLMVAHTNRCIHSVTGLACRFLVEPKLIFT